MRQLLMSALTAAALFCLSACTTSGLMTPPEPVGDPGPKTATTKQGAPPALDSPDQTSLAAEESRNIGTQRTQFPQDATTAGSDPQAMPPQPTGPRSPMLGSPGGVSATQKSIYQASGQPQAPGVLGTLPAGDSSVAGGSIRFLPIIGAPISAVTPLSRELATNASARGISIKPSSDNSAEHMLKGYFSAFDDGGGTTITYVWDVLDASGARLTRLQGQEKLAGKSADPWANVPPNVMSKIASDTINMYLAWKSGRRG